MKRRRAALFVVALVALLILATVALLVPPPRQQIEDDLASLAQKFGLQKSTDLRWESSANESSRYPEWPLRPSERYVARGFSDEEIIELEKEVDKLIDTHVPTIGLSLAFSSGLSLGAPRTEWKRSKKHFDWGTVSVELAYDATNPGQESTASLSFSSKKKTLAIRIAEWWDKIRGAL